MVEIRWHGRGGQGAKTASQHLALAQLAGGRHVQAFPEYGPERSGAPMAAYNRVDDQPIRRHDGVHRPDFVVVLDDTLLGPDTVRGLGPDGLLLVNTNRTPDEVRRATGHTGPVWCLPASAMARTAGVRHVNAVLVGALAAALGDVPPGTLERAVRDLLGPRLSPTVVEATVEAVRAGYAWGAGRRAA